MNNLAIAQAATLRPIAEIASAANLSESDYEPLGRTKAKLTQEGVQRLTQNPRGKLILVTAITPTPAGEGKTTTCVGLAQGLCQNGAIAIPAIREPALGPIFGIKGGACGGGYSQVLPMEDINLFFTGDFPAVAAAHNLLSAMLDAHLHHGNALGIDVRNRKWPRTVDMNDRALREIIVGLGGVNGGVPQQDGYVITPASEVMATLGLARSITDLKQRFGEIIVGVDRRRNPVRARDLKAHGAMTALMRDALRPNLVQTIEGGPAIVHGGPFANIAHGCSSLIGTQCALGMADYVVTEGGFAADLGAQKFLSILCGALGRGPDAIVLVATLRALAHHGDGDFEIGFANLRRHAEHLKLYGVPVVVAINRFAGDTANDLAGLLSLCQADGLRAVIADPAGTGGPGCTGLAEVVQQVASSPSQFTPLVDSGSSAIEKLETIAKRVYGGEGVDLSDQARKDLEWADKHGYGKLPVCIAKTQYSLSADASLKNAPTGFRIPVREVRVSAGAGFLVAVAGDIMLMPGLGKEPTAQQIDVDEDGKIVGLY